jgi:3-hydroxyacyl-CoA dehydrogenase
MREVKTVAVIGAGTIGASWAAYFLARGLAVRASDPSPGAPALITRMAAWIGASTENLFFDHDAVVAATGADFVQESAPERYEVKLALLPPISRVLGPDVPIASSSSGLLVSRLRNGCAHPGRVLIGHPFNPPHLVPLVEVVSGEGADPEAVASTMAFYRAVEKYPIHIRKEVPGHVANRLQAALWREAVHLVAEGVVSVGDVDAAISEGPGLRWALMGPNLTFHLAGGDGGMQHFLGHLLPAMQTWWDDLGTPVVDDALKAKLVAGVEEEAAGRDLGQLAARRDRFLREVVALRRKVEN